jgi:hypothetical protein
MARAKRMQKLDEKRTASPYPPPSAPTSQPTETPSGLPEPEPLQALVQNVTGGWASVRWTYDGQDESGFELEMEDETAGGNFHLINLAGALEGEEQGRFDVTVAGDHVYSFRMRVDYADDTVSDYVDLGSFTMQFSSEPSLTASPMTSDDPRPEFAHFIHLDWSPPETSGGPELVNYRLQYHATTTAGPGWMPIWDSIPSRDFPATTTSCDWQIGDGAEGWFRLAAIYADGSSSGWGYDHATQGGSTAPVTINATRPSSDGDTKIDLSGTAASGYLIAVRAGFVDAWGMANSWQVYFGAPNGDWQHTVENLTPGTDYYFTVIATDDEACEHAGGTTHAKTQGSAQVAPVAPIGLHPVRRPDDSRKVQVHWQNTPNNETSFEIERTVTGYPAAIATISTNADITTYEDSLTESEDGLTIYYRVRAKNSTGYSPWTDEIGIPPLRRVIALADRPVKDTTGSGLYHYSVELWSVPAGPTVFLQHELSASEFTRQHAGAKKLEGIELLAESGWNAYQWGPVSAPPASFDWLPKAVSISVVHFSDSGVNIEPVAADDAIIINKTWALMKKVAKTYRYAEQAPASGPVTQCLNWPNSYYAVSPYANNSNTFARHLLRVGGLSFEEMGGIRRFHPGAEIPISRSYEFSNTPWRDGETPPPKPPPKW